LHQSSAAVGPQLNVITACQEINSVFSTTTLILSQNLPEFFPH